MATDVGDIIKQNYLRCKSRTVGVWQKRWIVLRRASAKGPCRIEKYFDEKSARLNCHRKTIILHNVLNISRLPFNIKKHSFVINLSGINCKLFSCESVPNNHLNPHYPASLQCSPKPVTLFNQLSRRRKIDLEADSWVKLLIEECLVPQSGLATGEPDVLSPGLQKELQEQFHVYLMPTPKLDLYGEFLLQVTHENIYLWDVHNSRTKLIAWPLTALRRYGSDPTKFSFEAGRHCATGEGMFIFHTSEGEKIYRKVHQATLAIAEAHYKTNKSSPLSSSITSYNETSPLNQNH